MITKSSLTDTFREIRRTLPRFIAILAIIAIGTAFFVGIKTTCPDMKLTADKYYKDNYFMDFRLLSAKGFNKDDISNIKEIEGVKGVMPAYTVDALTILKDKERVIRLHSLPSSILSDDNENYINRPKLVEGNLPSKSGECLINLENIPKDSVKIGDKLNFTSGDNTDISKILSTNEFTIVGFIMSPMYISKDRGTSSIGGGSVSTYIMVLETDFTLPVYNEVYITQKIDGEITAYSSAYDDRTEVVKDNIVKASPDFWHVLDRNTSASYMDYGIAADRMDAIAQVFPVIFIMVAILICFTSMNRMVEENRTNIGTLKALGYSKFSITVKYLIYAIIASIIGGIIGLAFGFTFFPTQLFKAYSLLYSLPKLILIFDIPFAIISILTGILVTSMSVLIVCYSELNSNAAALMRPKAPKIGKIILLERIPFIWSKLKFTQKVTARNILRYKSRFFMTVIGVAGCTALLLVGFGLNDALSSIGTKQFGEIYTYQMSVGIKNTAQTEDILNINKAIEAISNYTSKQEILSKSVDIGFNSVEKSCGLIVPQNPEKINDYISIHERVTGKSIILTDEGVILTEKFANKLGVNIGSEIFIKDGDTQKHSAVVIGICENYLQHYMYMTPLFYEKIFATKLAYNQIDIKTSNIIDDTKNDISKSIMAIKGVSTVNFIDDSLSRFMDTIKSINTIVITLIVSAGLLSFIVLYTLTNININERIREIATIKVLGFYDKEVSMYVFRENIILTLIGIALGLVLGRVLAGYVIGTTEVDMVMFGRKIFFLSFLLSALMTLAFAWFVNIVMLRRLRKINMVEALKTIE